MTTTATAPRRAWLSIAAAVALTLPGLVLGILRFTAPAPEAVFASQAQVLDGGGLDESFPRDSRGEVLCVPASRAPGSPLSCRGPGLAKPVEVRAGEFVTLEGLPAPAASRGVTGCALVDRGGLTSLSCTPVESHPAVAETLVFGAAIVGGAFLLSWGAEVAQLDISRGLAIAFLAFIAVLPEYAVDLVFAWKAGAQDAAAGALPLLCGAGEECRHLAIANMTGANRLLIGIGWSSVVLIWWKRSGNRRVLLGEERRTDLGFLFVASLWALTIPIRGWVSALDAVVLIALFGLYLAHAALEEQEHPDLVGPPIAIAALGRRRRRLVTAGLFAYAAVVILAVAEHFSGGIVHSAEAAGMDPFLAVQWLAPFASEAPEMIIAILFVLRAKPEHGLGALVSSKVNQWTLLVGTLPLVYAMSRGSLNAMTLDARQMEEVLLTAAQSLFAVGVLANLAITRGEAVMLLTLFLAQFGFPTTDGRRWFAIASFAAFLVLFASRPDNRRGLLDGIGRVFSRPRR